MFSIIWDLAPCMCLSLLQNWLAANVSKSQYNPPTEEAPTGWARESCTASAAPPGVIDPSYSPRARKDLEMW